MLSRILFFLILFGPFSTAMTGEEYFCQATTCIEKTSIMDCSEFPLAGPRACARTYNSCSYDLKMRNTETGQIETIEKNYSPGTCGNIRAELNQKAKRAATAKVARSCESVPGQWVCVSYGLKNGGLGVASDTMMALAAAQAKTACVADAVTKGSDAFYAAQHECYLPNEDECQFFQGSVKGRPQEW